MPALIYTVISVGAGPGGLSAAAQAHANHVDYLLFDKEELGHTLSQRRGSKRGSQLGARKDAVCKRCANIVEP